MRPRDSDEHTERDGYGNAAGRGHSNIDDIIGSQLMALPQSVARPFVFYL